MRSLFWFVFLLLKKCLQVRGFPCINFFSHSFERKNSFLMIKKVDFAMVWLIKKAGLFVMPQWIKNLNG